MSEATPVRRREQPPERAPGSAGGATDHSWSRIAAVDPRVGDIDEEVKHDEQRAVEDDTPSEQEDVAVEDGVHEEAADAGEIEDHLHDDGAGEEIRRQRPEDK